MIDEMCKTVLIIFLFLYWAVSCT